MKQTEGEIFWEGYKKGILKATSIFRKHFRGGNESRENLQETIKRLRENVFSEIKKEISQ